MHAVLTGGDSRSEGSALRAGFSVCEDKNVRSRSSLPEVQADSPLLPVAGPFLGSLPTRGQRPPVTRLRSLPACALHASARRCLPSSGCCHSRCLLGSPCTGWCSSGGTRSPRHPCHHAVLLRTGSPRARRGSEVRSLSHPPSADSTVGRPRPPAYHQEPQTAAGPQRKWQLRSHAAARTLFPGGTWEAFSFRMFDRPSLSIVCLFHLLTLHQCVSHPFP